MTPRCSMKSTVWAIEYCYAAAPRVLHPKVTRRSMWHKCLFQIKPEKVHDSFSSDVNFVSLYLLKQLSFSRRSSNCFSVNVSSQGETNWYVLSILWSWEWRCAYYCQVPTNTELATLTSALNTSRTISRLLMNPVQPLNLFHINS